MSNWKPSLQGWFANNEDARLGRIENCDTQAWTVFLNYYVWMQACVDFQIGIVMTQLSGSVTYNPHTVVVFASGHDR